MSGDNDPNSSSTGQSADGSEAGEEQVARDLADEEDKNVPINNAEKSTLKPANGRQSQNYPRSNGHYRNTYHHNAFDQNGLVGRRGGSGGFYPIEPQIRPSGWAAGWPFEGPGMMPRGTKTMLSKTNIYIPGLPPTTTDGDLLQLCEKCGNIVSTKAIVDRSTGQCKGYGFVMFERASQAQKAIQALKAAGYQASLARESYLNSISSKQQQDFDSTNLYMANIPLDFTEQDLERVLDQWGPVLSTRILRTADGSSRGVGFVRLATREQCDEVVQTFNQKTVFASQPLQVRYADTTQQRRMRMLGRQQSLANMGMAGFVPFPLMQGHVPQMLFPPQGIPMGVLPRGPGQWLGPLGLSMPQTPRMPSMSKHSPGRPFQQRFRGPPPTTSLPPPDLTEQPAGLASQNVAQLTGQMGAMNINQSLGYPMPADPTHPTQSMQQGAREGAASLGPF